MSEQKPIDLNNNRIQTLVFLSQIPFTKDDQQIELVNSVVGLGHLKETDWSSFTMHSNIFRSPQDCYHHLAQLHLEVAHDVTPAPMVVFPAYKELLNMSGKRIKLTDFRRYNNRANIGQLLEVYNLNSYFGNVKDESFAGHFIVDEERDVMACLLNPAKIEKMQDFYSRLLGMSNH